MRVTFLDNLIFVDLIVLIILVKEYEMSGSTLCYLTF